MILFFTGFATGAVAALFSTFCLHRANICLRKEQPAGEEQERLNTANEERVKMLRELNRQYENMMAFTGKDQKNDRHD